MKRVKISHVVFVIILVGVCATFASGQSEPNQMPKVESKEIVLPESGLFYFKEQSVFIQMPDNCTPNKKNPMIIYFHGRGGNAENMLEATKYNYKELLEKSKQRGYIFVAPSCGQNSWMGPKTEKFILELLDFLDTRLKVDPKRFYVMGGSMGGGATLTFTSLHPDRVTAACDIFGITDFFKFYQERDYYQKSIAGSYGGTPEEASEVYKQRSAVYNVDKLKKVPLLIIHGDKDNIVYLSHSKTLYGKLKAAEANVQLIVVPGMGHSNKIFSGNIDTILDFFEANTPAEKEK